MVIVKPPVTSGVRRRSSEGWVMVDDFENTTNNDENS